MGMLLTSEDVARAELSEVGQVINGVDSANLMSVDSTTPLETPADELELEEVADKVVAVKVLPKEEKSEVEEKLAVKPDEKLEEKLEKEKEKEKKPEDEELSEDKVEAIDAVQKRFNEITKKRRVAERERDYEQTKRKELEAELQKLKAAIPPEGKPSRDDYDTDLEFFEALTDWKVEQKLKVSREVEDKTSRDVEEKQSVTEAYEELDSIMERGREKYKDFNTLVLDDKLVISQDMTEVILLSDMAEDLMYYFGSNPDESAKLAKESPLKAAREIGKIEAKLAAPKPAPPEIRKKTTNAPAPIVPIRTTGVVDRDPSQMTAKEYRAWREQNK